MLDERFWSKVNKNTVSVINALLSGTTLTQNSISMLFGVDRVTINHIKKGRTWVNVPAAFE